MLLEFIIHMFSPIHRMLMVYKKNSKRKLVSHDDQQKYGHNKRTATGRSHLLMSVVDELLGACN